MNTSTDDRRPSVASPGDPAPAAAASDEPLPAPDPLPSGPDWLREEIRRRMAAKPSIPGGRHAKREEESGVSSGQWTPGDGSPTATRVFSVAAMRAQAERSGGVPDPSSGDGPPGSSDPAAAAQLPQNLDPATTEEPPARVRVVLAERRGAAKPVRTIKEVQEDTAVGELLRSNLIGSQLSVALRFATIAGLVIGLPPLLFALVPEIGRIEVFGMRLPWLLLGVLVYPFMLGIGWRYALSAERVEQNFAEHIQD